MATTTQRPTESRPSSAPPTEAPPYHLRGRELFRYLRAAARHDPLGPLCRIPGAPGIIKITAAPANDIFIVRSPEQTRQVLITNQDRYTKDVNYQILAVLLGRGLLTNPDPGNWQRQRALVQPMFAKRHLAPMAGHMTAAATDWLDRWDTEPDGRPIDVAAAMNALTLDVVDRALFGVRVDDETTALVGHAMTDVLHAGATYLRQGPATRLGMKAGLELDTILRARSRQWRKAQRAITALDGVVQPMIDRHEADPDADQENLLALLLAARDEETGTGMSREQVRDEVMTFLAAGHETTANALGWMWLLLSRHPEVREQLHAEVDAVLGGREPTAEDVDNLPYTAAVFQESMRLYPPVPAISRESVAEDEVGGARVRPGSTMFILPYVLHRDPTIWPNPEGFDPRRFLHADPHRPRQAFMPFGAGRRICVGSGFALMEGILLAAMIAQRYTFDLEPGADVVPEASITYRPLDGLPMVLRKRECG
ncbi:MAG: cytochrome P450 [Solirubrobacteraceae bacterium]|nr:cytochrome P450 [Solirubrobacteraceae bacterium]